MCKEKWESINKEEKNSKNRKENLSRNCFYFKNNHEDQQQSSLYDQGSAYCDDDVNEQGKEIERLQTNNGSSSPSKSNIVGNVVPSDSCFPFLMGADQGGNLWENYGLKLNKENQNH